MNVSKIILRLFYFLKTFTILAILISLNTDVEVIAVILNICSKIMPDIDPKTMIKSKIFQGSLKYLVPHPIIFIMASTVKTSPNVKSNQFKISLTKLGDP